MKTPTLHIHACTHRERKRELLSRWQSDRQHICPSHFVVSSGISITNIAMDCKRIGIVSKFKYFIKEALKMGKIKFREAPDEVSPLTPNKIH